MKEKASQEWIIASFNQGKQLLESRRPQEAEALYREMLKRVGNSLNDRCDVLTGLGQSLLAQGRPDLAEESFREALELADTQKCRGALQTDLGNALTAMGRHDEARAAYKGSLAIAQQLGDVRAKALANGQLGALAFAEGNLPEATQRGREALGFFERLNEPAMETYYWYQLAMALQASKQWDEAEEAYRESARIAEAQGNLAAAANSWHQLGELNKFTAKPQAAEDWNRKALGARRQTGDRVGLSQTLSNLAALLKNKPEGLAEARQLAEESLAIKRSLGAGAAQIWITYSVLAQIALRQNDQKRASDYRQQAREAYRAFPGSGIELQKHKQLIAAVFDGVRGNPAAQRAVKQYQQIMREEGSEWGNLARAIDLIMSGQRNEVILCDPLDHEESIIVEVILAGIKYSANTQS